MKTKTLLLVLALAALPAAAVRADLIDNLTVDIRLGHRAPPPPPAVVVVVQDEPRQGPERWEKRGRWNQRNHAYYYYPGGDVYYRSSDRMWFYQQRGRWQSSRQLPEGIHVQFNHSVTLSMYTNQPYTYHQQVVARYPSNYFGTRVRVRDEHRGDRRDDRREDRRSHNDNGPRGNDHDGRDSDRDGRDKDKGNRK
jgi:hypothetical protein